MSAKNNLILIVDDRILDAQEMIREFTEKYGRFPVVSENGKKLKAAYENRKKKQDFDIKNS